MKKYILFTIFTVLASFATSAGIRFQDPNASWWMWFEITDDGICQTAAAENISIELKEKYEQVWEEWNNWSGSWEFVGYESDLVGERDKDAPNWIQAICGPNCNPNESQYVIPSHVTYLGKEYAVEKIGDFSFAAAKNISPSSKNIVIPSTVKEIGKGAFFGYSNPDNKINLGSVEKIGENAFSYLKARDGIEIPGTLEDLEDNVFSDCDIQKIVIKDGVKTISPTAFANAANISYLDIPGTVRKIEEGTFANQSNLKTLILGHGIEIIGKEAFAKPGLNGLTIPGSVYLIEEGAFRDCNQLDYLIFDVCDNEKLNCEHKGLKTIEAYAFDNCSALKGTLIIPETVEEIGDYAFNNSTSGGQLKFQGHNLKKVGEKAFFHWKQDQWSFIDLPASLTDFGEFAFDAQPMIGTFTDLYYPNANPNEIPEQTFGTVITDENGNVIDVQGWVYNHVCLHVPIGTRETYKSLPGWRNFKCIIDDLIPENPNPSNPDVPHASPEDPLSYIIDYLYLIPGEEINLNDYIGENDTNLVWTPIQNGDEKFDILSLDSNGNVVAKSYGDAIALATRSGNFGNAGSVEALAGAVIIFVCPTITVVYDKEDQVDNTGPSMSVMKAPSKEGSETTEADILQARNTTYTHPVIYNSFPKVQVNPPTQGIEIVVERASLDDSNNYIDSEGNVLSNQEGLTEVSDELYDKKGDSGYTGAVLPQDPVSENRMIVLSLSLLPNLATGTNEIEIDSNIKVVTSAHTLKIIGADEDSEVLVANVNGQVVYQGTNKEISLDEGIYVIKVEDATFKAIVR